MPHPNAFSRHGSVLAHLHARTAHIFLVAMRQFMRAQVPRFLAMGSSQSVEPPADGVLHNVVGQEYGFRVHRVEGNSPGQAAGLQSIVDYIVVANGVRLDHDDGSFVRMIAESKDKPMKLCVFDTHTLRTRETELTPCDFWGGSGLLGITIRFDLAQPLSKHTLHVLDVFPDSPASAAGLAWLPLLG